MDARCLLPNEAWLEEHLWTTEALTANGDDVSIGQLVCLLLVRAFSGLLRLGVIIQSDVRELLLHVTHDLTLSRGREGIATLCQDLHHILREVTACQIQAQDGMWQRVTFIDGHCVGHTIT